MAVPQTQPLFEYGHRIRWRDAVWEAIEELGSEPAVDLNDPDFELFVECRADEAYVFCEKRSGPGGLPLGTQRPVVALISGGIDSPVAAWKLMNAAHPRFQSAAAAVTTAVPPRHEPISTVKTVASYAPGTTCPSTSLRPVTSSPISLKISGRSECSFSPVHARIAEAIATTTTLSASSPAKLIGRNPANEREHRSHRCRSLIPVFRPILTSHHELPDHARTIETFEDSTIDTGCTASRHHIDHASQEAVRVAEPDDLFERAEAARRTVLSSPSKAKFRGGPGLSHDAGPTRRERRRESAIRTPLSRDRTERSRHLRPQEPYANTVAVTP